jgi:6-phosphofructokinase 1
MLSKTDVLEAIQVGEKAVEFACEGATAVMVGIKRMGENPYHVTYISIPIELVANKEKEIPEEWILNQEMSKEFYQYMKPLIDGEYPIVFENGIAKSLKK